MLDTVSRSHTTVSGPTTNSRDPRQSVIDINRGVTIRIHPTMGMQVFMYKDAPGVYLNAFGKPVPEQLASEAGFNISYLKREKAKLDRMAQAKEVIEQEFKELSTQRELVEARDGYKLYTRSGDRYEVEDPDGNVLNQTPLPKGIAEQLFNSMAPEPVASAV